MRYLPLALLLVATGLLCGCFDAEDELTINPDGSGVVVFKLRSSAPEEVRDHLESMSDDEETPGMYPPLSESGAARFFPRPGFKVEATEEEGGLTLRAEFKGLEALLNSPYGRAHQLRMCNTNAGELALTALPAGETLALAALMDPGTDLADLELKDPEALVRKRSEMKFTFRVHLPGPVTGAAQPAGGQAGADRTVAWTVERSRCGDDAAFLARLAEPLTVTCRPPVALAVTNPVRLGLGAWTNLAEGVASTAAGSPSSEAVAAAIRFVPETLQVIRTVHLAGEMSFGSDGNTATLSGHAELPPGLAPQTWGAPRLIEAVDSLGNTLLTGSGSGDEIDLFKRRYGLTGGGTRPGQGRTSGRQPFSLVFRAPEWKAKTIVMLKGELALEYAGGVEVLKMRNLIPTNALVAADSDSIPGGPFRSRTISDPRLARFGLSLSLQAGVVSRGNTLLMFKCSATRSPLIDLQVFDRDGRPWPTAFSFSEEDLRVMIVGRPPPPLSLALALGSGGTTLQIPFQFEQLPIAGRPAGEVSQ